MSSLHGFGLGIVSENAQGAVLDTFYPQPVAQISDDLANALAGVSGRLDAAQLRELSTAQEAAGDSAVWFVGSPRYRGFDLPCSTVEATLQERRNSENVAGLEQIFEGMYATRYGVR